VSYHNDGPVGHQLGGGVGGHLRLAYIILNEELDLLTQNTALCIDILHDQFSGANTGDPIRSQITAVRTSNTHLDSLRSFFLFRATGDHKSHDHHGNNSDTRNSSHLNTSLVFESTPSGAIQQIPHQKGKLQYVCFSSAAF
jgi:hypothetical protein